MVYILENPIKMDDSGVPLFLETPIYLSMISLLLIFIIEFWLVRANKDQLQEEKIELCWGDVWRRHFAGMKSKKKACRDCIFHICWLSLQVAEFKHWIRHKYGSWTQIGRTSTQICCVFQYNSPNFGANPWPFIAINHPGSCISAPWSLAQGAVIPWDLSRPQMVV